MFYKWAITDGTFNLVSRSFAPPEERLKSLIARERDIPNVLRAARENLVNPPPELTEQAIRLFNGAKAFFGNIVNEFAAVDDSGLQAQFRDANTRALEEIMDLVKRRTGYVSLWWCVAKWDHLTDGRSQATDPHPVPWRAYPPAILEFLRRNPIRLWRRGLSGAFGAIWKRLLVAAP